MSKINFTRQIITKFVKNTSNVKNQQDIFLQQAIVSTSYIQTYIYDVQYTYAAI